MRASKRVFIDDEEYTAVIEDIVLNTVISGIDCICVLSAKYKCNLYNKSNILIFRQTITKKEEKRYLDVIKEFCKNYKTKKDIIDEKMMEENLALQELEKWDGIIK